MTKTLERPLSTPESEKDFRLDLNKIAVSEHLSADSPFELRTITPTAEKPVAVYMAASKIEDKDSMNGSFFAIKENAEAFWQSDTSPDSMGVIRCHADGSLEQLGVGDDAPISGTFKVGRGEKILLILKSLTETLKEQNLLTEEGLEIARSDEDLRKDIIEFSIDSAIADVKPEAAVTPATVNKASYARRIRERNKQGQQAANSEAAPAPTPEEIAMSAETHRARADRAAELVQRMNAPDPEAGPKEATRQAWARRKREQLNTTHAPSSEVLQETVDAAVNQPAANQTRQAGSSVANGTPLEQVADKKPSTAKTTRADEQTERSYKVFDQRKWSRVDVLGQEIGAHGRIDFKKEQPVEEIVEELKIDQAPEYETVINPNDDPAIEQAINKLDSLRDAMADAVSGRRGKLFSLASKKRNELAKSYNDQIVTLGQFVNAENLASDTLTDSQKNLLVTKFVINEQMRLQAATKDKLKDTKAAKLIEWMNVHNQSTDETLDARVIMQAIEQGDTNGDKFTLARRSMSELYEKRIGNEQHEHRKKAVRVAAIGTVAMFATAFGINPSTVGDAMNNVYYGTRKK